MNIYLTKRLTPLFNQNNPQELLKKPHFENGHWRALETLVPRGMPMRVEQIFKNGICKISTPAYPSKCPLYTHFTYLKESNTTENWQKPLLPPLSVFLKRISFCIEKKIPYLWGGTSPLGTHSFHDLYYRGSDRLRCLNKSLKRMWTFTGLDCSGLIYWATRGATARNTSELVEEGSPVKIENLNAEELITKLQSGMLIVWKGHVLLVTDQGIVESSPEQGVRLLPKRDATLNLLNLRAPLNAWPQQEPTHLSFVVRDLYPDGH